MNERFKCQFAIGEAGQALSGVWMVWAAKNWPDLYCAALGMGGEIKASIHSPRPPEHPEWRRHWGFDFGAKSDVAKAAKQDGGPHKIQWPGCPISAELTLEWRINFPGSSLRTAPIPARPGTILLPIPGKREQLQVAVIIGPAGPTKGYPREESIPTHLLAEGRLSNGRRVSVVYLTFPLVSPGATNPPAVPPGGKGYASGTLPEAGELRAACAGLQPDGSLGFFDLRADLQGPRSFVLRP
jgi:hypothetical protein